MISVGKIISLGWHFSGSYACTNENTQQDLFESLKLPHSHVTSSLLSSKAENKHLKWLLLHDHCVVIDVEALQLLS